MIGLDENLEAVLAVSMLTETALRVKIDIDENQSENDRSTEL